MHSKISLFACKSRFWRLTIQNPQTLFWEQLKICYQYQALGVSEYSNFEFLTSFLIQTQLQVFEKCSNACQVFLRSQTSVRLICVPVKHINNTFYCIILKIGLNCNNKIAQVLCTLCLFYQMWLEQSSTMRYLLVEVFITQLLIKTSH